MDIEIDKNYSKKTQKSVQNLFPKKYEEHESGQSLKCKESLVTFKSHTALANAKKSLISARATRGLRESSI